MSTPPDSGIRYEQVGGLPAFLVDHLGRETGLRHAIFTRQGGLSLPPYASLNLGQMVGDDPRAVDINHRRVHRSLGIHARQLVTCHLVHGNHVFVVDEADGGQLVGQGDALVTDQPGLFLSMRFADCLPILINDSERHVVGLVHAGWRGTMLNVVGAAVEAMVGELGCSPNRITAVIGPGIGPCCYQVGDEVIEAVDAVFGEDKRVLSRRVGHQAYCDLWEANRLQLSKAGVKDVTVMGMCTACNTDHFFSHRAEEGKTGRFGVVIGYQG